MPSPALFAAAALAAAPAAPPAESGMEMVGQASHSLAFWTLYDAYLYAPGGRFAWDRPFALTLEYRRAISAARIADVSVGEMARIAGQGEAAFAPLRDDLAACFADVESGDRITGYSLGPDRAVFSYNGRETCTLDHPGFRDSFFGIWLAENSRRPEMSARLRGARS